MECNIEGFIQKFKMQRALRVLEQDNNLNTAVGPLRKHKRKKYRVPSMIKSNPRLKFNQNSLVWSQRCSFKKIKQTATAKGVLKGMAYHYTHLESDFKLIKMAKEV